MQHLWKDTDNAIEHNLLSFALTHSGLVVLENCNAILRRDYSNMIHKVKLISGGASGNEPAYAGFVGPGMLTAAIYGNITSAPTVNSIIKVIQEIGTNHTPGVLLIVPNFPGHCINFGIAKARAESMGIYVKMVIVGDDVYVENSTQKRGFVGTLFIIKIAGTMAECGESLDKITNLCNKILNSEGIATISVGMKLILNSQQCSRKENLQQIEIGYGVHGEVGDSPMMKESIENVVNIVMNKLVLLTVSSPEKEPNIRFNNGCQVAVMINNIGATNEIEFNVFTVELLKQMKKFGLSVQRIYKGRLMTSLDSYGFQVSILNLSNDPILIKYLDTPTLAPGWPKVFTAEMLEFEKTQELQPSIPSTYSKHFGNDSSLDVNPQGIMLNDRNGQVLMICISFACEALRVCVEQLNKMDRESGDGDCGTSISRGANAIITAIRNNKLHSTNPFAIFFQISYILEKEMDGLQGGLYSLFFLEVAKVFAQTVGRVTAHTWLNALIAGNNIIAEFGKASYGDRTMLDPLISAQNVLSTKLKEEADPIEVFGEAVKAAENSSFKTINVRPIRGRASLMEFKKFILPDPGAHAVGIWMRAAYEGVKLKLNFQCEM